MSRLAFFTLGLVLFMPSVASAASLYLTPASGTYSIGGTLTATIYVESTGQALNAVSGTLSIPTDAFDIVGVSSAGSIVNFWVQEPAAQGGNITFEGVVLNPGYSGSAGKIAAVTLRAKRAGSFPVTYSSASILANDGKGTNLLSGTRGGSYTVREGDVPVPKPTAPVIETEEEAEEDVEDENGPTIRTFSEIARSVATDPSVRVQVSASDPSGIKSYEFSLDGGAFLPWEEYEGGVYELKVGPGAHTLALRVTDTNGNETRRQIVVLVTPLQTPKITEYPTHTALHAGIIEGTVTAGITRVVLTATPESVSNSLSFLEWGGIPTIPQQIEAVVRADGEWLASLSSLETPGKYRITATGYDVRGGSSLSSESVYVVITPGLFTQIVSWIISVPVLLVLLLAAVVYMIRHRGKANSLEDVKEIERSLKHSFSIMRRNIAKERVFLSHRHDRAAAREQDLLETLEENIETTESRTEKKIEEIEEAAQEENR
ncbi:cohesin domain-containing protein [Patescibacteria group bacterium]|nr:cohesin domain-containing protein [Patescibacteria group bacterium]